MSKQDFLELSLPKKGRLRGSMFTVDLVFIKSADMALIWRLFSGEEKGPLIEQLWLFLRCPETAAPFP